MIDATNLPALIGADVVDADGDAIGTVSQIFVAPGGGGPRWMSVRHGFGGDWFVPVLDATSEPETVRIPYTKKVVKHAPGIHLDGALTAEQERDLTEYYDTHGTATDEHNDRHDDRHDDGARHAER